MSSQPQYEFDQGQNVLINDLANKMQAVGFVWRFVGLLFVVLAIAIAVVGYKKGNNWNFSPEIWAGISGHAFVGLFNVLIGGWTLSAANNFRKVSGTTGNDISHLMSALRSLHEMFGLIYMLIWLAIIMGLASIGMTVYGMLIHGAPG